MILTFDDHQPVIDETAWVASNATVVGNVTLHAAVGIFYGAVLRADMDSIEIGEGSNIQDNCALHVDPSHSLTIGRNVSVGHNATLHGCTIEDDVLIGMGATVLNGAVIGAGSMVAAGALVTQGIVVPPGSLVAGVPGKVRRELTDEEKAGILLNAEVYRDLTRKHAAIG
ncbi:gamma carbonic anhydrase family protein [Branchiibius sp. NY16-3462-2]|uniref:gamma carbonic anhydrase family protein n=1 Tax=Branchiibius sp. NY16-3462-2 TaxID=1807500 RepID=UPI0007982784|nr:gamma carbonic anhydrase family protein [Branchiibius sp. NY16-3462-2]KYH45628.1 gamma carbonic anhydrase family protein [Branchiibius sp. NY16-3462-2]